MVCSEGRDLERFDFGNDDEVGRFEGDNVAAEDTCADGDDIDEDDATRWAFETTLNSAFNADLLSCSVVLTLSRDKERERPRDRLDDADADADAVGDEEADGGYFNGGEDAEEAVVDEERGSVDSSNVEAM
jgi:hypothetical protein